MAVEFLDIEIGDRRFDAFLAQRGETVHGSINLVYPAGKAPDWEVAVSMALRSEARGLVAPDDEPRSGRLPVARTNSGGGTGQIDFAFSRVKLTQMTHLIVFLSGRWRELEL